MDQIWLRTAAKLHFKDPPEYLRRLRLLEHVVASSDLPSNVKALRTNELKQHRELREAALFCHGMSNRLGVRVEVARDESRDYDFVARIVEDGRASLFPVQLKELVPSELNSQGTLADVFSSLTKYADSDDLTVAVHLNRHIHFNPDQVSVPPLKLGGLWVFGAISPDQSAWALWGDFLTKPIGTRFEYPAA
jgi:hypothetical protein